MPSKYFYMLRNTTTDCHVVEHAFYYHLPSFFVWIFVDLLHFSCLILLCCTDIAQFAIPFASSYRTKNGEDIPPFWVKQSKGAPSAQERKTVLPLQGELCLITWTTGRCPGLIGVAPSARFVGSKNDEGKVRCGWNYLFYYLIARSSSSIRRRGERP